MNKLYHLSQTNLDGKILQPRVPSNFLVKNGYEDNKTKRVCFTSSIDKSLRAMSQNLKGMKLYVHTPDKEYETYNPSIKEVPDGKVTGEVWIKEPVKLKCIGQIEVIKDKGEDGIPYKYGNHTAELYDWDWKWIEKINESYIEESNNNLTFEKTKSSYRYKNEKGVIASKISYYDYSIENFNWVLVANVDTKPNYRRMGLASDLINKLYSDIMSEGKNNGIYVFVKQDNTNAISLYKKLNFRKIKDYKLKDGSYFIIAKGKKGFEQFNGMHFTNEATSFNILSFYNELKEELERNEDGFFMITPSKDKEELDDAYNKFNAQNPEQKKKADIRSAALYGMNNYDHYHILLSKIKKGTKDDEADGLEYNRHDKEVVKEQYDLSTLTTEFKCINIKDLEKKIESAKRSNIGSSKRVILYPTQDINEIESLFMKYMALKPNDKISSDNKAYEMFNKNNREIYDYIKTNVISTKNDEIEGVYKIKDKKIEKEVKKDTPLVSNDLPLLTPSELSERVNEDYSCFNETDAEVIKKWRTAYSLLGEGVKTPEYNDYNKKRLDILRKSIYENNTEAIIHCGWNPEIEFNLENRAMASKIVREKMEYKNDIIPFESIEESFIQESSNEGKKAVSIVLIKGNSFVGKTIQKVQRNEYSHASISLDDDLDRIYSFNSRNGFNGLVYESISQYIKEGVQKIGIYTFLVTDSVYKAIEKVINNLALYINKTKYSTLNLLTIPLNITLDMDMKMVCSQFVDKLLKTANVDLTGKKSSLVSPKDFTKAVNNRADIVEVFNGNPKDFDKRKVTNRIKKLTKSNINVYEFVDYSQSINEVKEFPVQFDDAGNLLIKNIKKINFEHEYNASHTFLKSYDKAGNIEGMKYELSKLFFLNKLLENRIYNSRFYKKDKDKYIKTRARVLNDFNKYLDIVLEKDKDFIFSTYYDQTPFSDAIIKINNPTIKFSIDTIKYAVK